MMMVGEFIAERVMYARTSGLLGDESELLSNREYLEKFVILVVRHFSNFTRWEPLSLLPESPPPPSVVVWAISLPFFFPLNFLDVFCFCLSFDTPIPQHSSVL